MGDGLTGTNAYRVVPCEMCGKRLPYPRTICDACEDELEREHVATVERIEADRRPQRWGSDPVWREEELHDLMGRDMYSPEARAEWDEEGLL